jgi:ubiquitin C-terminal hydrolase
MFDSSGEQNDAHEFLVFIFDRLNDEILKLSQIVKIEEEEIKKDKNDETEWEEVKKGGKRMKQVNTLDSFKTSIIGRIFQGSLKHELESKGNSLSKCNIEPFFVLSLDFGENSIESCFDKFFKKRKIETDKDTIFQKSYLEKLPSLLIIHLKAFYFDKNTMRIVKINKEIEYGTTLKLKKEYFSPSMQSLYKNVEYELSSGKKKRIDIL